MKRKKLSNAAIGLLAGVLMICMSGYLAAQVSLTTFSSAYTQDFNTLVNTGSSSTLPTGWALFETGTLANTTYTASDGSANTGDTYSYGATSSTDRAFGELLSGSLTPTIGCSFQNNTGGAISSIAVAYMGEMWRLGDNSGRIDRIDFQYSL
ncbi:MAG TPA: hypothetical protein VJ508_02425, partial [Saprospiraceae bacterium]|nr:hypothetical protein [Saprospiraceae bacterium]